ncbi:MAG: ABC transporter permease subunit [Pirellulales bacterium]|nr:ABC transporter permease subunit [Pirellulales bacterium]
MSSDVSQSENTPDADQPKPSIRQRARRSPAGNSVLAQGEPMVWLTGGALALCLLMILGLLGAVLFLGMSTFQPLPIVKVQLHDGSTVVGEVTRQETFDVSADSLLNEQPVVVDKFVENAVAELGGEEFLADLPSYIKEHSTRIEGEIAETTDKVALLEGLIEQGEKQVEDRIAAETGGKGRVQDRLDAIRASAAGKKLKGFRAELSTIRGKVDALKGQLVADQEAIDYLATEPKTSDPSSDNNVSPKLRQVFDAPRPVKVAVVNTVLDQLAKSRGVRKVNGQRRLFRIGNKKITGKTFQWVADFEVKPESQEEPEWSIIAERTEWGRFYGTPKQFSVRHERVVSDEEKELAAIVKLFDENLYRAELDETQQAAIQAAIEPLRKELAELRKKRIDEFFAPLEAGEGREVLAIPLFGEPVAANDRAPDADYVAALEVWKTPKTSWKKFEEHHDDVLERSARRHNLKKHDLGHVSHTRIDSRKLLREQELKIDHQLAPIDREKRAIEDKMAEMVENDVDQSSEEWTALQQRLDEIAEEARKLEKQAVNLVSLCSEIYQYRNSVADFDKLIDENNALAEAVTTRLGEDSAATAAGKKIIASLNAEKENERKQPADTLAELEADLSRAPDDVNAAVEEYFKVQAKADEDDAAIQKDINQITEENNRFELLMATATGDDAVLSLDTIVRAYPANQLTTGDKAGIYASRWWEFISADPREANSEGGVLPAIWGTVVMTLIMSIAVAPFGVLAALYLREYAKAGIVVSVIRISISNLAGVPSIVFGVFGLGFFCYGAGKFIDGGPGNAGWPILPTGQWYMALAGLAVASVVAFVLGIAGATKPGATVTPAKQALSVASTLFWMVAVATFAAIVITTPYFRGFYEADLPTPTFGKGGMLWASLTLALLTLPVVIVATEEALAAVPNSMREGSYGCGASKWQTIRNIVLPHALPGIMTGMILAMARGAGEVAPLMLVGAVKLAPELPVTLTNWAGSIGPLPTGPLHSDRSFMHLGFHIYDLGFQSQDSEAAKPMVFTTTLLLILIIALLNIGAIWLRAKLRKRFQSGQF